MTRRRHSVSARLRLADPALKPVRAGLLAGLEKADLALPGEQQSYLAYGEQLLSEGLAAGKRDGMVPLLVLEGPTPQQAHRLPASLVVLPLEGPATQALPVAEALAEGLITWARKQEGAPVDFVGLWRRNGFSCEAAGEPVRPGASGSWLEKLLSGRPAGSETTHPVWSSLGRACEREGVSPADLVNQVLTWRTIWLSPYSGDPVSPQSAAEMCRLMLGHWQENALPSHCYGAQYWNHPSIRATFSGKGGEVSFHETQEDTIAAATASGGRILSWAGRTDAAFEADCSAKGVALTRIEDGFLRSVGLGAGLARGAMLAADDLGIYYDPSRPSRLEVLLQEYELSAEETARGATLIDLIRAAKVSKYNFGATRQFDFPADRTRILVPGQVADDAAIRKSRSETIDCANTPNVNIDLLRAVRTRNPDAFLVFKPHPDVETGLRKGKVSRQEALAFADEFAEDANIVDLIEAVDRVETFSSLSGFEALLRGKAVAVHGAPFYAGWGLCEDLTPLEGRTRQRSLPELVYLALVQYARTIDPVTLLPCTPEFLVSRLAEQRTDRKHLMIAAIRRHASWLGRKLGL